MGITYEQITDWLLTHVHEMDGLLEDLAEARARGTVTDEDASQATADVRRLQDLVTDAIARHDLRSVHDEVIATGARLLSLAMQGRLP